VARNETILKSRFQKCKTVSHIREKQRVVSLEEKRVGCYTATKSDDLEDVVVMDIY
jgi:hypothetical protein